MIQQLTSLRGIGVQSATVLAREAFVPHFSNGKALGSYAGLTSTPYSSGGIDREQGIGKAGNRRLRTVMVELAWLWPKPGYNRAGSIYVQTCPSRSGRNAPIGRLQEPRQVELVLIL
jgi:transposase